MALNATFNNISVLSWRLVLLVEETGENYRPVASHWQTVSQNVVSSTLAVNGVRTHIFSCDMIWFRKDVVNPTTYDHDHESPSVIF